MYFPYIAPCFPSSDIPGKLLQRTLMLMPVLKEIRVSRQFHSPFFLGKLLAEMFRQVPEHNIDALEIRLGFRKQLIQVVV